MSSLILLLWHLCGNVVRPMLFRYGTVSFHLNVSHLPFDLMMNVEFDKCNFCQIKRLSNVV